MSDERQGGAGNRLRAALLAAGRAGRASAGEVVARFGWRRLGAIGLAGLLLASPWPALTCLALVAYAAAAFDRPGLTVALIPLTLPFAYQPKSLFGPVFPVAELLLALAVATTALHVLVRWRRAARAGAGAAAILDAWDEAKALLGTSFGRQAAALALIAGFSLLTVADRDYLRESLREYRTVIVEPVAYFFLARHWLRSRQLRGIAIAALLAGAIVAGLLGIGQVVTGIGAVVGDGVRRAIGPYHHPNALALYLVRVVPFAAALLVFAPAPRRERLLLVALPLGAAALALTFSRGALLGLLLALALLGLLAGASQVRPGPIARGIVAAALLLVLLGAGLTIAQLAGGDLPLLRSGGDSLGLRRLIWRSTLAMLRDHPAFGVGLDQFYYQYAPRYIDPVAWGERFTSHPHNLFLDFWVRLGIMGLAWVTWTLLSLAGALARGWQTATPDGRRLLTAVGVAGLAAFAHGLVDNFYFLIDLAFLWWLLLALMQLALGETNTANASADTLAATDGMEGW